MSLDQMDDLVTVPAKGGSKPRLLLLISGGWAVRNYLRSGFLEAVLPDFDVVVMLPEPDSRLVVELQAQSVTVTTFESLDTPLILNIGHGFLVDATNRRLGFQMPRLAALRADRNLGLRARALVFLRRRLSHIGSKSPLYDALRGWVRSKIDDSGWIQPYRELMAINRPDVVLSSNPYSLREIQVCVAAAGLGIPTLGAIGSWDHLTYKGPPMVDFSQYVVWSPMMKMDLLAHIGDFPEHRIHVTGTPQFDFHVRQDLIWSRDDFFRYVGGDPERRLIVWSASTDREFAREPDVIAQFGQVLRETFGSDGPQLLVRFHPHDRRPERFDQLRATNPGIMLCQPWPTSASSAKWFTPTEKELALLSNSLRHADVNINMASSVTLDAAILDTPIINAAFTSGQSDIDSFESLAQNSVHYSRVVNMGAVNIARSIDGLMEAIEHSLKYPYERRDARKNIVDWICGPVDGQAHIRIASALKRTVLARENV